MRPTQPAIQQAPPSSRRGLASSVPDSLASRWREEGAATAPREVAAAPLALRRVHVPLAHTHVPNRISSCYFSHTDPRLATTKTGSTLPTPSSKWAAGFEQTSWVRFSCWNIYRNSKTKQDHVNIKYCAKFTSAMFPKENISLSWSKNCPSCTSSFACSLCNETLLWNGAPRDLTKGTGSWLAAQVDGPVLKHHVCQPAQLEALCSWFFLLSTDFNDALWENKWTWAKLNK